MAQRLSTLNAEKFVTLSTSVLILWLTKLSMQQIKFLQRNWLFQIKFRILKEINNPLHTR